MQKKAKTFQVASLLTMALAIESAAETTARKVTFEDCNLARQSLIAQYDVKPRDVVKIIESNLSSVTRICIAEVALLFACSRSDNAMIVLKSPRNPAADCRQ